MGIDNFSKQIKWKAKMPVHFADVSAQNGQRLEKWRFRQCYAATGWQFSISSAVASQM